MIESLTIENFRGFKSFKLSKLGKINLLVGSNNSGKTSILEAIHLFAGKNSSESLLEILNHRGEFSWHKEQEFRQNSLDSPYRRMRKDFNIRHLFYGHKIELNPMFSIKVFNNTEEENLKVSITDKKQTQLFDDDLPEFFLSLEWIKPNQLEIPKEVNSVHISLLIPFSREGNIRSFLYSKQFSALAKNTIKSKTKFITTFERDTEMLTKIFDEISLTPKEKIILDALKIIEPKILRIATQKSEAGEKSSFKILLDGYDQPIPISIMGDGIWQLLTIALAMVSIENGILLIDEIDSGLHFTTLFQMWQLISETAEKLNIQVFATTHNSDCWLSLANFVEEQNNSEKNGFNQPNTFTMHRIESNKKESIMFDDKQIVILANEELEIR